MDSGHWTASDEHQNAAPQYERPHVAATSNIDNVDHSSLGNNIHLEAEPSFSSSSSSEASSDEDFFQLEATELSKPVAGLDEMLANLNSHMSVEEVLSKSSVGVASYHQVMNDGENSQIIDTEPMLSSKLEVETAFSPNYFGGSPGSDTYGSLGVTQSPPIQLMGKSDDPVPNRIPYSVFARTNTAAAMEWSVASNESLFSIHIGRSGDLTGCYVDQMESYSPISPLYGSSPVKNVDLETEIQQSGSAEAANAEAANAEATNAEAMKEVLWQAAEVQASKNKPSVEGIHCGSTSRYSDASVNSFRSFAFPILTTEGKNGLSKSESVHKQKPKVQPETPLFQPEEPPKAEFVVAKRRWFSWCTCSFRCCCCHLRCC